VLNEILNSGFFSWAGYITFLVLIGVFVEYKSTKSEVKLKFSNYAIKFIKYELKGLTILLIVCLLIYFFDKW